LKVLSEISASGGTKFTKAHLGRPYYLAEKISRKKDVIEGNGAGLAWHLQGRMQAFGSQTIRAFLGIF
jgi:hypothetical protein